MKSACCIAILLFGCSIIAGCHREPPGATVCGKVIYKNAPFAEGSIIFYPAGSGQVGYANVRPDGTFQLLNAKRTERIEPGHYVAVVIAGTDQIAEVKEGGPRVAQPPAVPYKFSSVTTSPLKYDVIVGENKVELNLDQP
jgi:hypothetical protein